MGVDTTIPWCHHTFSAWWGCSKVSPGCDNCYAEAWSKRTGFSIWGAKASRRFFTDKHWNEPRKWDRDAQKAGERRRVFCQSMSDVFESRPDLREPRARLWRLIRDTPNLDWLLLTKRIELAERLARTAYDDAFPHGLDNTPWLGNMWLGTTCEDQKRADQRVPVLLNIEGPVVRFVSAEPLLERTSFAAYTAGAAVLRAMEHHKTTGHTVGGHGTESGCDTCRIGFGEDDPSLDWIIAGGESGGGARPLEIEWIREIVEDGHLSGTAVFVKQLGAKPTSMVGNLIGQPIRLRLKDRKGEDMSEFPNDLQLRQFPTPRLAA